MLGRGQENKERLKGALVVVERAALLDALFKYPRAGIRQVVVWLVAACSLREQATCICMLGQCG